VSESLTNDQDPNLEPAEAPQEDAESTTALSPDAMARELERARKEAAKYRTRLREREEAEKAALEEKRKAEMTADERAQAAERKAAEALEAAEARVRTAERKAALAGVVTKPDRVLRLGGDTDDYWNEDGTPNKDAILRDFSEYAPQAAGPGAIRVPGAPQHTGKSEWLKPEDFKGKSQAWREANIHRLRPPSTE
jgi:hypothetical protein